eukprot:TRINITY_DN262_c0_g2_i1.p1 TRINITY_DN262_c0_g2~~TRINITY_DN262_c0_g2_i1.p1  ORF type:complete len:442 (+),score=63.46 TRINITY_DN262_c0_g2_i1:137-1462(+)
MGSSQSSSKAPWEVSMEYKYKDRQMPYRMEQLELSQRETNMIKELTSRAAKKSGDFRDQESKFSSHTGPVKIIFDTDIGTDIDDSLALLAALNLPPEDVEIMAITTVYGWTNIRAGVAKKIVDHYEGPAKKPPVIIGAGVPLGTHRPVWHTGTEGCGALETDEIIALRDASEKIQTTTNDAAEAIVSIVNRNPGEIVLLGLGALTNIGQAILLGGEEFKKNVKRIVYMGQGHRMKQLDPKLPEWFKGPNDPYQLGGAYPHYPNHNLSSDTMGAMITFESGIPLTMVNDAVTNKLWFDGADCLKLAQATAPGHCREVGNLLRVWLTYRSHIFFRAIRGTCPHDALTLVEAIYPHRYMKFVRGWVIIHEWAAFSTFIPDPDGPHEIGESIEAAKFMEWLRPLLAPANMESSYDPVEGSILDKTEEEQSEWSKQMKQIVQKGSE